MAKGRKNKVKIDFVCKDCGYKPELIKKGNFEYTPTTCPKCGGKIGLVFE